MTSQRIFVTGAGGFLGRSVVAASLEAGHRVRALLLPGEAQPGTWDDRVEVVRGDIVDSAAVTAACSDCDAIIHLAALVGDWSTRAAHQRVTVDGTAHALAAARIAGAHFLLASSVCAYGDGVAQGQCREDGPLGQPVGSYSWAKQQQEQLVRDCVADGLRATVVRPANIYGPGSGPWLHDLVPQLRAGRPTIIGNPDNDAGLTYVDNVADLFVATLSCEAAYGQTFNACDGLGVSWSRFFTDLARLLGAPAPKRVPLPLLQVAAPLLEGAYRLLEIGTRPPITREALNLVGSDSRFDNRRAREVLGWTPRVDYAAGMEAVARYIEETGL